MSRIIIIFLCGVAIFIGLFYFSRLQHFLTLEQIKLHSVLLQQIIDDYYSFTLLSFTIFYTLLTAFAIPTAGILTIAGGAFFGVLPATLAVCVGATVGATAAFLTARYMARNWIELQYPQYTATFNNELNQHGTSYLLMIRLLPMMPFFVINPLAGLTQISLTTFVWTTAIGIIPATALYAFAGKELSNLTSTKDVMTGKVMVAFLLLAFLSIVPMLIYRLLKKESP